MQSNTSYQKNVKTKPAKEAKKPVGNGKQWKRNNDKRENNYA